MNIEINLFWIAVLVFVIIGLMTIVNMIGRYLKDRLDNKKDIHFKDKDVQITSEAFNKIGEVKNATQNEILLNKQNVQNNLEIYTHDVKIENLEDRMEHLEKYVQDMNGKIQSQLDIILKELQHRG